MEQVMSQDSGSSVPGWSGVPTFIGTNQDIAVIPLHVSDTRSVSLDSFEHVDYYETLDGEVEYHVYHRVRVALSPVPLPIPDQRTADMR